MKVEQETMYAAALQSLKGCGSRRLQALLDVCRSPSQAWGAGQDFFSAQARTRCF